MTPAPVMSYVDMELTQNNSTSHSTRCRRSRRLTLRSQIPVEEDVNLSLSFTGCSSSPSVNQPCKVPDPDINQSISSPPITSQFLPTISSSPSSMRCPQPSLVNLNDDKDPSPSTPPRPSSPLNDFSLSHQTPQSLPLQDTNPNITLSHQPSTESGVAFIGCTANSSHVLTVGEAEKDDSMGNGTPPNIPSVDHRPEHQSNPEQSVVLNDCTDGNGNNLPSFHNTSNMDRGNEKDSDFVREWHNRFTSATTFVEFSRSCDGGC